MLLKDVIVRIHSAPILQPERVIHDPIHTDELEFADIELALRQVDHMGILVTSRLEEIVKHFEIVIAKIAKVIDAGSVELRKVLIEIAGDEFILVEKIAAFGQQITAIDHNRFLKRPRCFEHTIILPPAAVQVCDEEYFHLGDFL